MSKPEIVWLTEERIYAHLIHRGAFFSTVQYIGQGAVVIEETIPNDEYEFFESAEDYESE